MLALALACVTWTAPLTFRPQNGWRARSAGTYSSLLDERGRRVPLRGPETSAWTATAGVHYRDRASDDPPNRTVPGLRGAETIVYAVAWPVRRFDPDEPATRLDFARARHFACCEGGFAPNGEWEVSGAGPAGATQIVVRVYFGSPPTAAMRAAAQRAIDALVQAPARRCG